MDQLIDYIKNSPQLQNLLILLAGIMIIIIVTRIIKGIIPKYIKETNQKYRTRKFINYIGYFLFILLLLIVYSNKLSGFTVFLGVAGAGIAFSLQEVIASIAGFIAINFSNFYKVGDRVMLGGIKGDVIDIAMLRTTLMQIGDWVDGDLYNGKMVRIANSFIFKEPVFNYSGDFPFLWDEVKIPVKSESDHLYAKEKFMEILNRIQGPYADKAIVRWQKMTEKLMVEDARVHPTISMSFDENWITFTLRYVVNYKRRRATKDLIFTDCLEAIRNSKDKIKIASAAMEITAFPKTDG